MWRDFGFSFCVSPRHAFENPTYAELPYVFVDGSGQLQYESAKSSSVGCRRTKEEIISQYGVLKLHTVTDGVEMRRFSNYIETQDTKHPNTIRCDRKQWNPPKYLRYTHCTHRSGSSVAPWREKRAERLEGQYQRNVNDRPYSSKTMLVQHNLDCNTMCGDYGKQRLSVRSTKPLGPQIRGIQQCSTQFTFIFP